ncbi:Uncharacterized protein TCAP_07432 [Tolypocladium capitatum]|uniref:Uncharacterized protein n=1 Tax=Tolypocladium capitatum TaxID=45235 RepID=A0A2K3PXD6_9HYPO|nr:Uncharacterized protein TCAP_07432 [Tolypocladium capitatum]
MPLVAYMNDFLNRCGRSPILSPRNFQYACAFSGILVLIITIVAFAASGFLPPPPPSWDAEQVAEHYREHETGIQAGAALLAISGMSYLAFTAAISAQMRRIPNLPHAASALQLASGAACAGIFEMVGLILAATNYRLERPAEITQALNDLFWFMAVLSWPIFMAQGFALAYAILIDCRPKPPFPKPIAIVSIVVPILYVPGIAVHCTKTGPLAWSGVLSFWIPLCAFGVQTVIDSICLLRAVFTEAERGEKFVDVRPAGLENGGRED